MTEESKEVKEIVPWMQAIGAAKTKFNQISNDTLDYAKESLFAMQAISKNDYILKAAYANPTSVRNAVINISAVGLSLNPATKYAYLVPRDNEICLDISYIGLIKIATDTGSIKWAKAEVVYEADDFQYHGPSEKPSHTANVFSDRGNPVGCYCIAKTADDDYLIETMTAAEIDDIRAKSKGSDSKYSAWKTFPGEMWKKAVIKRASKTWPKTSRSDRFDNAVHVINETEGLQDKYLSSGHEKFDPSKEVDYMKVEEVANLAREIVDEDDMDNGPGRAHELIQDLSQDEYSELCNRLKLSHPLDDEGKPIRKTYMGALNGYLTAYKDQQKLEKYA